MNKSVYKIAITVLLMLGMRETFASCAQIQAPKKLNNPMVYNVVGNSDASLELKTQYFSQDQEEFISEWFSTPVSSTACFDLSNLTDSGQLDPFTITKKLCKVNSHQLEKLIMVIQYTNSITILT